MTVSPGNVRNVALVGHSGVGKTTLAETLLYATGTTTRAGRVEDGTTVCDYDDAEVRQQRSVSLALAPFVHNGVTVNLLDTPGYADFVGDLRAGLRAADAALFVVSAVDPIDAATRQLWEECSEVAMPRAIVVTRLDQPRADFEAAVGLCQQAFGPGVLPLYLPLHEHRDGGDHVAGLIGLLSQQVADYSSGSRVERGPDPEHRDLVAAARSELIEGVIAESEDETLLERYLGGEEIDTKVLVDDLETAVARGSFYPVLGFAAPSGLGAEELLELLVSAFPAPDEHPLPTVTRPDGSPVAPLSCDPDGPLCAEVVKTTSDPYVGRVSLVRVFSGTLRPDLAVHVSGHGLSARGHADHDVEEKVGHLFSPLGKQQRPLTECRAGDLCAVAKLSHAETGDTLSLRTEPLLVEAWSMPEGLLPVAVAARAKTDEDKLATGLTRLVAEDPTLRLERNAETGQLVVWCLGEAQADMLLERLRNRFAVAVDVVALRVPLRETFTRASHGLGRHVKQSGGHGQYAICQLEVSPLPGGSGFEFVDRIVGGAVPNQYIPSVEKGVRAQLARGLLAGYPVVDVRVELVDGKYHPVDSSDLAFQTAGALALRDAAAGAVSLLEPVLEVCVLVPDDYVGAVLGDLSGRRGRVTGTEPLSTGPLSTGAVGTGADSGRTVVRAEVPETEMVRYAVELRSLTHGGASFTRSYLRHDPMPAQLAAKVAST